MPVDTATRTDHEWMAEALALARQGEALTSPNPMVGAVIVKDGEELARAFHTWDGLKHAEVLALEQADSAARGATLYTNLEPCSHHGRTGPCVEAIVAAGIGRVVAAIPDPNPEVNGRGFEQLRAAGVEVLTGIQEEEARRLNEAFAGWIRTGRPFVTLKAALTLDGRIAPAETSQAGQGFSPDNQEVARSASLEGVRGNPVRVSPAQPPDRWVTSEESRAQVQNLRHQSDAIITGIGTVLADDPLLTDRTGRPRRRPLLRVILDAGLRLPLESQLVKSADGDVLVLCGEDVWMGKRRQLEERGVETLQFKEAAGRISLHAVLRQLAERRLLTGR